MSKEKQMQGLTSVYHLTLIYSQTWQAINNPPRSFDSERCLVAACLLTVFDAILRPVIGDAPLIMSVLLQEERYSLSTTLCQNSRPFDQVGAFITSALLVLTCGML